MWPMGEQKSDRDNEAAGHDRVVFLEIGSGPDKNYGRNSN